MPRKRLDQDETIHSDPLSAWRYLCSHGGVELKQRDQELQEGLRILINARQPTLELALATATMESFVSAFFQLIHPFVSMFQDILNFFIQAQAKEGQSQWSLKVGEVDIDLDHFRKWIEKLAPAGRTTMKVADVRWNEIWELSRIFNRHLESPSRALESELPPAIQDWVQAYERGEYRHLPALLSSSECPLQLENTVAIAYVAITTVLDLGLDREGLMAYYRNPARPATYYSGALDLDGIAQNETDYWIKTLVVSLSRVALELPSNQLDLLFVELQAYLDKFPTRSFEFNRAFKDLESVLSLPIWKKRYELYSVWIGTEIVRALTAEGHSLKLHHENGRIEFAFHETTIATIESSSEPFRLISERRSSLDSPIGRGRVAGVQPDYGLWTTVSEQLECRLVIEVKHYLRSATAKFLEVLQDYARAFPKAEIYLVNHGPTGSIIGELDREVRQRCHTLDKFLPSNIGARDSLAKAVNTCVGTPIRMWPALDRWSRKGTIFAFDVSSSMTSLLSKKEAEAFLLDVLVVEQPEQFVGIDTSILGYWPPTREGFSKILKSGGGSTSLTAPVRELLQVYDRVLVLTDEDGLRDLEDLSPEVAAPEIIPPNRLSFWVCQTIGNN
jgi:hypothetical protein